MNYSFPGNRSATLKTMLTTWRRWCRLCAKEHSSIDIFSKNEDDCDIAKLIRSFFQLSINTKDEAPVTICTACYCVLLSVEKFAERAAKAQAMYSSIISRKINTIDCASIKYQFGLVKEELDVFVSKCDQATDTADLAFAIFQNNGFNNETTKVEAPVSVCKGKTKLTEVDEAKIDPIVQKLYAFEQVTLEKEEEEAEIFQETAADYSDDNDNEVGSDEKKEKAEEPKTETQLPEPKKKRGRKRKERSFQCNKCDETFQKTNDLRDHKRARHSKHKGDYTCEHCDKKFPTLQRAQQHSIVHLGPDERPTYPCPHCSKTFLKKPTLRIHIRAIHVGEKPFICESCGKSFVTKGALKEHTYAHIEERPFQCSTCNKGFKTRATLKVHEDIHNGTMYECPNCGLILNTKRTLHKHMVVHSDQRKYKCSVCDREFKRTKTLKNHMILHTGLRPYSCPFCDKTFGNVSHFRSHKSRIHKEEIAALEAAHDMYGDVSFATLDQSETS